MRVALVIPPVKDFYFTRQRASFLGVHTIAHLLGEGGIECRVFNGTAARGRAETLPGELSYLEPHMGREYFFKGFRRFGVTAESLAEDVREYAPEAVFVSCVAFCYALEAIESINFLKALLPSTPVYVGGPGPSVHPGYFLGNSTADFAVSGEAEVCLAGLLDMPRRCPQAVPRDSAGDAGMTTAPGPSGFTPVLVSTGENSGTVFYSTMVSRGCPRQCAFCSVRQVFRGYRRAGIESVRKAVSSLRESRKNIHVNFEDDNLTLDFDYFVSVLELLDRHTGGRFSFSMENGAEFDTLDEERIAILKRYRLKQLNVAVGSTNERVMRDNGREFSKGRFTEIARICEKLRVPVIAYIISGLPGESCDSIMDGVSFLRGLPVLIGVSTFYPVPGTRGFEDRGFFDGLSPRLCAGTSFYPWGECTTEQLVKIFIIARTFNLEKVGRR